MKLTLSTKLNVAAAQVWDAVTSPAFLAGMSEPMLKLEPIKGEKMLAKWHVGASLTLKVKLAARLPAGEHTIRCVKLDDKKRVLETSESGTIAKTWDHVITVKPLAGGRSLYTDKLEIKAGLLTMTVWSFAQLFYRFRQHQLRTMLDS